jgi:hypothetical protein
VVAANQLMPVRVGDIGIEVEAVPITGIEATSGRAARAAGDVLEALGRAQDAIIEVAKSTAEMIEKGGRRPPEAASRVVYKTCSAC